MPQSDGRPKPCEKPTSNDIVSVLMTEEMARRFEDRCLKHNTRGYTELSPPVKFSEDDVPTYIIRIS